jgi:hypothetical protein
MMTENMYCVVFVLVEFVLDDVNDKFDVVDEYTRQLTNAQLAWHVRFDLRRD